MNDAARRTELKLYIENTEVTKDLAPYLLTATYTDNEQDKADDLQLTLHDRDNVWIDNWLSIGERETTIKPEPEATGNIKGAEIEAIIIQKNWNADGKDRALNCGIFEIDNVSIQGPPTVLTMKATSVPRSAQIREQKKTKMWENITLSKLAGEIAAGAGMKLLFDTENDVQYIRKEQTDVSDLSFLKSLCYDVGLSLKISSKTIIIFDEQLYESKGVVKTLKKGDSDILTYRFSANNNDTAYSKCHVSYTDPATGQVIEYTYTPRDADKSGQILEINEKVNNREEARQLAMKRLRQKNKKEYTAEFSIVGDANCVAGINVQVEGFGYFDGKYAVETTTHNITGGYTVSLRLHKVSEEY